MIKSNVKTEFECDVAGCEETATVESKDIASAYPPKGWLGYVHIQTRHRTTQCQLDCICPRHAKAIMTALDLG